MKTTLLAFVFDIAALFPFQIAQNHCQYHFQPVLVYIQGIAFVYFSIANPGDIEGRSVAVSRVLGRIGISFFQVLDIIDRAGDTGHFDLIDRSIQITQGILEIMSDIFQ